MELGWLYVPDSITVAGCDQVLVQPEESLRVVRVERWLATTQCQLRRRLKEGVELCLASRIPFERLARVATHTIVCTRPHPVAPTPTRVQCERGITSNEGKLKCTHAP
eukprot:COSAG06_NODE_37771_length_431_cov_0.948795_1_plen_107_part_10